MKILFLIAQYGFRDEEYFIPKQIFNNSQIKVTTASIDTGRADGKMGGAVDVDISAREADMQDYEALVIAGGPGAVDLKNHDFILSLIRQAYELDKIIGAICIAPILLAAADVIKGKKLTVWNADSKQSLIIENAGAFYIDQDVVVDGKLVTGNGPESATEFANQIVKLIRL
jgi:protease I